MSRRKPFYNQSAALEAIANRDGWRCRYCGHPVASSDNWVPDGRGFKTLASGYRYAVRDHVVPRARGGSDHAENLVLACGECNMAKGARTPEEWLGVAAV